MKTNLAQQLAFTDALVAETSRPRRVVLLRGWLKDNGYEGVADCKHYAIVRITGKCYNCGVPVADPMPSDSDESLEALRDRLSG